MTNSIISAKYFTVDKSSLYCNFLDQIWKYLPNSGGRTVSLFP